MKDESDDKRSASGMQILGINLGVLAVYTIVSGFVRGGIAMDTVCLFFHAIICFAVALVHRPQVWILSGLMVAIIGFSTCTGILSELNH